MANFFNSPFLSAPERDTSGRDSWKGYTTTSRLPLAGFNSCRNEPQARHGNLELGRHQGRLRRGLVLVRPPRRETQPAATTRRSGPAGEGGSARPGTYKIPSALECESLPIVARSPGLPTEIQGGGLREGMWSGGQQLFVRASKTGDYLELSIPDKAAGKRKVTLYGTKAPDYGILKFRINGQPAGPPYDAYHSVAIASGPIELGTFEPKDGKLLLRVEVVGANRAAIGSRYFFGLDCVTLQGE